MSLSFFEKLAVPVAMTNEQYLERIDFFRRLITLLESMADLQDNSNAIAIVRESILDLEARIASQAQAQRGFRG